MQKRTIGMKKMLAISTRDCGSVGHIGIITKGDKEVYRTGIHHPTKDEAFMKCVDMMPQVRKDHNG